MSSSASPKSTEAPATSPSPALPTAPARAVRHRVAFSETDAAGLAHFTNFFRWMEEAEAALFRQLGHPLLDVRPVALAGFPRRAVEAVYHAPARFDDEVEVRLWVAQVRASSVRYRAEIRLAPAISSPAAEPGPLLAELKMTTVYARRDPATGAVIAQLLPDSLRARLASLAVDV